MQLHDLHIVKRNQSRFMPCGGIQLFLDLQIYTLIAEIYVRQRFERNFLYRRVFHADSFYDRRSRAGSTVESIDMVAGRWR